MQIYFNKIEILPHYLYRIQVGNQIDRLLNISEITFYNTHGKTNRLPFVTQAFRQIKKLKFC